MFVFELYWIDQSGQEKEKFRVRIDKEAPEIKSDA